jgi:hypothetical protein
MFLNFIPACEDDPTFWATAGWYGFLVICAWAAFLALRLGCRTVGWLASRDQSDWVALVTKLFLAPFGSGYLYLFNGNNQVIFAERACLVVMADEERMGGSAFLAPRCEWIQAGRITFHCCRPETHAYLPGTVAVDGKPTAHRDVVGYHAGSFIFSPRPIAAGLLAALRRNQPKPQGTAGVNVPSESAHNGADQ